MPPRVKKGLEEKKCICCGYKLLIEEFFMDTSQFYKDGYLPICRECLNAHIKKNIARTGNLQDSIAHACSLVNVPCLKVIIGECEEEFKKPTTKKNYFEIYYKRFSRSKLFHEDWRNFSDSDVSFPPINNMKTPEDTIIQMEGTLRFRWGEHTKEEYLYLEDKLKAFSGGKNVDNMTEYERSNYVTLCLNELDIYQGTNKKEGLKIRQALSKSLGIDFIKVPVVLTPEEKMLERWIDIEENVNPVDFFENKELFKDMLGIGKDNDMIMRSLKNLVTGSREYPELKE